MVSRHAGRHGARAVARDTKPSLSRFSSESRAKASDTSSRRASEADEACEARREVGEDGEDGEDGEGLSEPPGAYELHVLFVRGREVVVTEHDLNPMKMEAARMPAPMSRGTIGPLPFGPTCLGSSLKMPGGGSTGRGGTGASPLLRRYSVPTTTTRDFTAEIAETAEKGQLHWVLLYGSPLAFNRSPVSCRSLRAPRPLR